MTSIIGEIVYFLFVVFYCMIVLAVEHTFLFAVFTLLYLAVVILISYPPSKFRDLEKNNNIDQDIGVGCVKVIIFLILLPFICLLILILVQN